MLRSFGGTYRFSLQGDNLVHMDTEMCNMQTLHGAETQRRVESESVMVNYAQTVAGERSVLTVCLVYC